MRRSWDIIRHILIEAEKASDMIYVLELDYPADDVRYNTALLIEAGLLTGSVERTSENGIDVTLITGMTWAGHDLLDAIRSRAVWEKVKAGLKKAGGSATVEVLKRVAEKVILDMAV
jgi:hypothetical protein